MNGLKRMSCKKCRMGLQDLFDRVNLVSVTDGESILKFMPREFGGHLEQCSECSQFFETLTDFAPALLEQIDRAVYDPPTPDLAVILERQRQPAVPQESCRHSRVPVSAFQKTVWRLFGPARRPVAALRWASLSLAGLLLASVIGFRVYTSFRTNRAIEQEVGRIIEQIYQEPLLAGIETALVRTRADISDYVEDLSEANDLRGWEMKERMAQIQRQVQLRTLLGDTKYARLTETVEARRRVQEEKERSLPAREEKEHAERARP